MPGARAIAAATEYETFITTVKHEPDALERVSTRAGVDRERALRAIEALLLLAIRNHRRSRRPTSSCLVAEREGVAADSPMPPAARAGPHARTRGPRRENGSHLRSAGALYSFVDSKPPPFEPVARHETKRAPRFTLLWIALFAVAFAIVFTGIEPIAVTEYAFIFSVVALPFTYLPLLLVACDPEGEARVPRRVMRLRTDIVFGAAHSTVASATEGHSGSLIARRQRSSAR